MWELWDSNEEEKGEWLISADGQEYWCEPKQTNNNLQESE